MSLARFQGAESRLLAALRRGLSNEAVARGINIKKGGTDPPLKPANEYPEFVHSLAVPEPSLYELRRKIAAEGEQSLSEEEAIRITKLESRSSIKARNALKAKK